MIKTNKKNPLLLTKYLQVKNKNKSECEITGAGFQHTYAMLPCSPDLQSETRQATN